MSCKGVNKSVVLKNNPVEIYKSVLDNQEIRQGTNSGFICKNNTIKTYIQTKDAFSYLYMKRIVLEHGGGVYTRPLDIFAQPINLPIIFLQNSQLSVLQINHPNEIEHESHSFNSIYQTMVYDYVFLSSHDDKEQLLSTILNTNDYTTLSKIRSKIDLSRSNESLVYSNIKKTLKYNLCRNNHLCQLLIDSHPLQIVNADPYD